MIVKLKANLWDLYRSEERSWQQKSRIKWFLDRDRNTKFFHAYASNRRRINYIDKIVVNGRLINHPSEIKEEVACFFESLYTKRKVTNLKDFNCHFRSLNDQFAANLEIPFSEGGVWEAINGCDGNKAPGPNGFNFSFFQKTMEVD